MILFIITTRIFFLSLSPQLNIRDRSSDAAFLVKVVAMISLGKTSSTKINFNIFKTITVVFPEPGPATINKDWDLSDDIAAFWSEFEEISLSNISTTSFSNSS